MTNETAKIEDAAFYIAATLESMMFQKINHMRRLDVSRPSIAADWLMENGYAQHGKSSNGRTLKPMRVIGGRTSPGRALYLTESGKAWARLYLQTARSSIGACWAHVCYMAHAATVLKA